MATGIGGKIRENTGGNNLYVGLFEAEVIAINPTTEEYKSILNIDLKEDSKAAEYLGESRDGNTFLRVDFWLKPLNKDITTNLKVTYFLENSLRTNKDDTKKQFINNVGSCSWADLPENLPNWFKEREFRPAYSGEEDLYSFIRTWLGKLDFKDTDTVMQLDWKKLMKGNVKEIKEQLGGDYSTNVLAEAVVITREKEGETKEFQGVYGKVILPVYCLKQLRLVDYDNPEILKALVRKEEISKMPTEKGKTKEYLKIHEKFVVGIFGEYGCKDFFILKDIKVYDPADNFIASDKEIDDEDGDY